MSTLNLFAYGTLMDPEIMAQVSGCNCRSTQATLYDHLRRAVEGELYPAIAPRKGDTVEGVVYFDLPQEAFERLDRFEGPLYRRTGVVAVSEDGGRIAVQAYVIAPEHLDRLSDRKWDFVRFLRDGKEAFQKSYRGYEALNK